MVFLMCKLDFKVKNLYFRSNFWTLGANTTLGAKLFYEITSNIGVGTVLTIKMMGVNLWAVRSITPMKKSKEKLFQNVIKFMKNLDDIILIRT